MERVAVEILEVDDFHAGGSRDFFVECLAEVFVVEGEVELAQGAVDFRGGGGGVEFCQRIAKNQGDDVAGFLPNETFEGKVREPQPDEMENGGDFHPGVFVEFYSEKSDGKTLAVVEESQVVKK